MSYIALATREYGDGRICIMTDRIGGYRTGHGDNLLLFWRKLLEWTALRKTNETISIAVVESTITHYEKRLSQVPNVLFKSIDLQYITLHGLDEFNLVYFIGLPESVNVDVQNSITSFVENGHGIFIETPDRQNEFINVLIPMDMVYCSSVQRPLYSKAYWTQIGTSQLAYEQDVVFYFMTTLLDTTFSTDWNLLMTDIEVVFEKDTITNNIQVVETPILGSIKSEFGLSYVSGMQNGLVYITEEKTSDTSESSMSYSSSSSSSIDDPFIWSICDNILAQWKMNENYVTSFVWDSSGNFNNICQIFDGTPIATSLVHTSGKINGAFSFTAINTWMRTIQTGTLLNFTDTIQDIPFSICVWIKPNDSTSLHTFIEKQNVWEVFIQSNTIIFSLYNGIESKVITTDPCVYDGLWYFVVITYDGVSFKFNVNDNNINYSTITSGGYTTMSNDLTHLFIGANCNGSIDNLIIVDRDLDSYEIEGLWNRGMGTEKCYGTYAFTSSSSYSSNSVDSNSSSSTEIRSSSSTEFMSSSSSSSIL